MSHGRILRANGQTGRRPGRARAPERVHAELVAPGDGHAGDDERLGGVALGQDERARLAAAPARIVRVVQLGQACRSTAAHTSHIMPWHHKGGGYFRVRRRALSVRHMTG